MLDPPQLYCHGDNIKLSVVFPTLFLILQIILILIFRIGGHNNVIRNYSAFVYDGIIVLASNNLQYLQLYNDTEVLSPSLYTS